MNSFTRIGLPIILLAGVVFAITFATRYTSEPDENLPGMNNQSGATGSDAKKQKEAPLKYFVTEVASKQGVVALAESEKFLKYWSSEVEIDQPGSFGFWVANKHSQPVQLQATYASCTCTNVEMANVPPTAFADYAVMSAIGNSPLVGSPLPSLLAGVQGLFSNKLAWTVLYDKEHKVTAEVDAATNNQPQLAIVKMKWNGKAPEGGKNLDVDLLASLPNSPQVAQKLKAATTVVPSYGILARNGVKWDNVFDLNFGEFSENGSSTREVFVVSSTRVFLPLNTVLDGEQTPCISISEGVPATNEELRSLSDYTVEGMKFFGTITMMKKYTIRVQERTTVEIDGKKVVKQLDLGVLDRRVKFEGNTSGDNRMIVLRGRVLGDFRILNGSQNGKIDLGNGLSTDQDHVKVLTIIAERDGLDVTFNNDDVTPHYLKVKLEPQKPIDGRKVWRLTVTLPKGALFGALPLNSVIYLKTNDPTPRKLRIPVVGSAYDSGVPRL